jgi:hypothetical protein
VLKFEASKCGGGLELYYDEGYVENLAVDADQGGRLVGRLGTLKRETTAQRHLRGGEVVAGTIRKRETRGKWRHFGPERWGGGEVGEEGRVGGGGRR